MKLAVALMALSTPAVPFPTAGQAPQPSPAVDRPVFWKRLLPNIVGDQERIWSFPARLVQGQSWIPTAAILGTTAGLVALDPTEASYFRRTSTFHGLNNIFTGNATAIGTMAAPVSLYAIGLIRKDAKMERTALLAAEAVGDAEILTTVLKDATKRVRPAGIPASGDYSDSWFESGGSVFRGDGSFPSGHAIAALLVATVFRLWHGRAGWIFETFPVGPFLVRCLHG